MSMEEESGVGGGEIGSGDASEGRNCVLFWDERTKREMKYIYPDSESRWKGWLCWRHPDGYWVTYRRATQDDIRVINQMVVRATHRVAGEEKV